MAFSMREVVGLAVLIPIALLLFVALGAVSIDLVFDQNTSAWDTATQTVWNLLPVIAIVAFFLVLVTVAILRAM